MITYMLALAVKSVFVAVLALVKVLFGSVWTTLAEKAGAFVALPGVEAGLGLFDAFVGIDYIVWAVEVALLIVVTMRLIRLVIGIFSKG